MLEEFIDKVLSKFPNEKRPIFTLQLQTRVVHLAHFKNYV